MLDYSIKLGSTLFVLILCILWQTGCSSMSASKEDCNRTRCIYISPIN